MPLFEQFLNHKRNFYQDTLGTKIENVEGKGVFRREQARQPQPYHAKYFPARRLADSKCGIRFLNTRHFPLQNDHLPRQARDNRRETGGRMFPAGRCDRAVYRVLPAELRQAPCLPDLERVYRHRRQELALHAERVRPPPFFGAIFNIMLKTIDVPRLAWDKHRTT